MDTLRRDFIRLTAAGLFHIAARPFAANAEQEASAKLLIRKGAERGHTDLGWLESYHSFSFGEYYDQRHMNFRSLRVINDDRISAGKGFPTHPHRDMEILSYVMSGSLQHRDSTGQGSVVQPGDVQLMSAGTGITHSEYNPSSQDANHFLQVWLTPSLNGLRPSYQQVRVETEQKQNRWQQIAGPDKQKGIVAVHQDVRLYASVISPAKTVNYIVERGRHAWLHVAAGRVSVNGTVLHAGDAVATSRPTELQVGGEAESEVLLFDLA